MILPHTNYPTYGGGGDTHVDDYFSWAATTLSQERIKDRIEDMSELLKEKITFIQSKIDHLSQVLTLANPLHKLKQGYSIATLEDTNIIVKSTSDVLPSQSIRTEVIDGFLFSTLIKTQKKS